MKGRPCALNRNCFDSHLVCSIREAAKGEKCLLIQGGACKSDNDCTSNLMCMEEKCDCPV